MVADIQDKQQHAVRLARSLATILLDAGGPATLRELSEDLLADPSLLLLPYFWLYLRTQFDLPDEVIHSFAIHVRDARFIVQVEEEGTYSLLKQTIQEERSR